MRFVAQHVLAVLIACAIPCPSASAQRTAAKLAAKPAIARTTLDGMVQQSIMPELQFLFDKLVTEQRALTLDGVAAFNGKDKFLSGKIAIGMAHLIVNTPRSHPKHAAYLAGFQQIADLTLEDVNETWGIYYYLSALNRLREAGLLDRAVRPTTLAALRTKLDWRGFVAQPAFTLINLPTNYYGVAFSIARLRFLLGWEDTSGSEALLRKTVNHYETYSGKFGFSDETDGEGRFDRYSVLLIGEICQRFLETAMPVTPQLKAWLRNSVDLLLPRLNDAGQGFEFGRSIGPYGETAYLEVLAAAAKLNVLTPVEKDMAYAFATRATERYTTFWFDASMRSVNMWEHGRRTDAYRGKFRILGENLSLSHQLIYTNAQWNTMGFRGKAPTPAFANWLKARPRVSETWFARGEYDRALYTVRDASGRIFSLPLVNGGSGQHDNSPYFPIPYSHDLVQGVADVSVPQLIPKFELADGAALLPVAYYRDVSMRRTGNDVYVSYAQREMDKVGATAPAKDARLTLATTYSLSDGVLTRKDIYTPSGPIAVKRITLEFASFSENARPLPNGAVFATGVAAEFTVDGLHTCATTSVAASELYRAPTGQMKTLVRCTSEQLTLNAPITISWRLKYRARSEQSASVQNTPPLLLLRGDRLAAARAHVRAGDKTLLPVVATLRSEANQAMRAGPWSVTEKKLLPPGGDARDYQSFGPYWWPDSSKTNGLPYIRRDGVVNPVMRRESDAPRLYAMTDAVETLSLAYFFTGEERYAQRATFLLRRFFLDSATGMRPHLRYGQAIPGVTIGRGIGIIDTRDLGVLADAIVMLRESKAWTRADDDGMLRWNREFLAWLIASEEGNDERKAENNHGMWYDAQVVALALFVGDTARAGLVLREWTPPRLAQQLAADGSQPEELARTRPLHYSGFNLEAMTRLAELGRHVGIDLWHWRGQNGADLKRATEFIAPYLDPAKKFPKPDVSPVEPVALLRVVRRSASALADSALSAAVNRAPTARTDRSLLFIAAPSKR